MPELTIAEDAQRFRVEGMDCASCARTVEKAVASLDGAQNARVSFGNALLVVEGSVEAERVERAVAAAGYRARPATLRPIEPRRAFWRSSPQALSTSLATLILLAAVAAALAGVSRAVAEPLYLLSMAVGGWFVARAALVALYRRSLDMNVLMTLAAVGAVGIGAYSEGAWVLVLFAVGTTLESYALDRSRRSVRALMELAPAQARIIDGGVERLVPVKEVVAGTLFVVHPGERVALDGVVVSGSSSVDEAPITGESIPREKTVGDEVFAGSLNEHGALTVRTSRPAEASTLARIAQLVEDAQGSQAPSERLVDRFARVYTPLVFVAALLVLAVPIALGGDSDTWIYRALALLIVACPCSLVISIPVSVVSAVGGLARRGVLVKGGQALEDLAKVRTIAFDKTGTLTLGLPRLVETVTLDGVDEREALRLVASLERRSEHPLAAALVRAARDADLRLGEPDGFRALPGRGVQATIDGRELWAGGPRLATERLGAPPAMLAPLEAHGQTTIILGEARRALAAFGLADTLRAESHQALHELRAGGLERQVMLTGDSEPVAASVAGELGIREWRSGLLPEDKLRTIAELDRDRGPVAMVGDGINDAPALAAARVGIAMGAAGTDAALAAADVALMSDDLHRLPDAIARSQQALRVMRQNVIASLAVKAIFVVLAPLGLITLVIAVAADMGMSLLVTLNGLRLLGRHTTPARTATTGRAVDQPAPVSAPTTTGRTTTEPRPDDERCTPHVASVEHECADGCCTPAAAPHADEAGTTRHSPRPDAGQTPDWPLRIIQPHRPSTTTAAGEQPGTATVQHACEDGCCTPMPSTSAATEHDDDCSAPADVSETLTIGDCGLDPSERRRQADRYQRLGATATAIQRPDARALIITFGPDFDQALLQHTIAVERECCTFFDIDYQPATRRLQISVAGHGDEPALTALHDALAANNQPTHAGSGA
jgi:Cd2+/Zn2+-exporting ATPase